MRRQILRSTLLAVVVTLALFALPSIIVFGWLFTLGGDRLAEVGWQAARHDVVAGVLVSMVILSGVALGVGAWLAGRRARLIARPLQQLAERAERLGAGESRFQPLDSGIGEVDRVSEVLSRSAQQITRNLAEERDFAADASHQLRTPLTALLLRLEEISMTDHIHVVREEAHIAMSQVERLSGVVDDLMARSRSRVDERPTVSLDSVLASLQREWQPAFAAARRSIRVEGERGLRIRATPVALAQILTTLLENSLAHGAGTVGIDVRRAGPSVVIEVKDQGEGVAPALAPHIFERSVSSTGSGLGLTLARDLAEANGGRLELVSAQPAVFAVFLSQADPAP